MSYQRSYGHDCPRSTRASHISTVQEVIEAPLTILLFIQRRVLLDLVELVDEQVHVDFMLGQFELAGQLHPRRELAALVEIPDLVAKA